MRLSSVQRSWQRFGETDPYWAILTVPGKQNNQWDLDEFLKTGLYEIGHLVEDLDRWAPGWGRERALDFGCGVGRLTQPLAAHFAEVIGVDIAPSMIERAQTLNRCGERCRFVLNQQDDLRQFGDRTFDLIYSSITLQHMRPRFVVRYLTEFVRLLKPGGVLVFQLPDELRGTSRIRQTAAHLYVAWIQRGPVMEMHGMSPERVRRVLETAGAELVAVEPDGSAGATWNGYRYCVRKPGGTGPK